MTADRSFTIAQTEAQFQSAVQQLASLRGWSWMHIRPGLNERGHWRTPISGRLGSGWPDLVLIRGTRMVFAELKAQKGKVTGLQSEVLAVLTAVPCAEVYVWRPSDWELILDVLN